MWIAIMDQKPKPPKKEQTKTSAEHVKKHTKTLFLGVQDQTKNGVLDDSCRGFPTTNWQSLVFGPHRYKYQYSRTRRWRKFQKWKNIWIKRTCAYRIVCDNLDWLNLCSDDSNKVGVCWGDVFWWSNVVGSEVTCGQLMWWFATCDVMWCDVISCCPVLLSTTKYYSVLQSTTPVLLYYKVLLQYYKVLLRTTKYYASTTLYYKVLLRTTKYYASTTLYYSSTTKYYTSTTPYYKVLRQHNSVLLQY